MLQFVVLPQNRIGVQSKNKTISTTSCQVAKKEKFVNLWNDIIKMEVKTTAASSSDAGRDFSFSIVNILSNQPTDKNFTRTGTSLQTTTLYRVIRK